AWMGREAERAGLPPELPVMAALQESTLRNLTHGDRDSVGFFQMRVSIWDNGPYAGYLQHPELQMKWFIARALEEKAKQPGVASTSSRWNEWIANIENCAAEDRGKSGPPLEEARRLLAAGHVHDHPAPRPAAHDPSPRTGIVGALSEGGVGFRSRM